jgi:flagellar FliL protein
MATSPKETGVNGGDKVKKPKSKLLLIIIIAVIFLGGAGFGAYKFLAGPKTNGVGQDADEVAGAPSKIPVFLTVDPFVVNLQPENGDYYLQTSITLQLPTQATADSLKLFMPQVRSRIIMLLSSKKASELITNEGKEKLRDDIIDELSEPFSGNRGLIITDVAFTSFVIQAQ